MLVLSRKVGESIVLPGCHLVITLLDVNAGKVRLGITAPHNVRVYRQEVWERIRREAAVAAANVSAPAQ